MPFYVSIAAFNAAGEQVRLIYDGRVSQMPLDLTLDLDRMVSLRDTLGIVFDGTLQNGGNTAFWRGDNDAGQELEGGIYSIRARLKDPFAKVTTLARQVLVLAAPGRSSLTLYNSAGEAVRAWDLASLGYAGDDLADVVINEAPQPSSPLQLNVKDTSGAWQAFGWDGLNDRGLPAASGTYTLTLVSQSTQGRKTVSKSFTLIQAPGLDLLALAKAGPLPLKQGSLKVSGLPPGAAGRLYALSGELVSQGHESGGTAELSCQGLASGTYVLVLESGMKRRLIKVAVLR